MVRCCSSSARMCLALGLLALSLGCANNVRNPDAAAPPPTFTGPSFLYGTVGSLTSIHPDDARPMMVSGFGVVVGLDNTGSRGTPAFLRNWLVNEMRRQGVGRGEFRHLSPSQMLADPRTAVVVVEALIPPGAPAGSRFDVRVTALPQTQTTSLRHGYLYTTDLARGGANLGTTFRHVLGKASGDLYLNPFHAAQSQASDQIERSAVIIGGGRVNTPRRIRLLLNSPSAVRARAIADRINERYGRESDQPRLAVARTEGMVELHVPERYAAKVRELTEVISHLYINRAIDFEPQQAKRLGEVATADPRTAGDVALAWQGLGRHALNVMREYYGHDHVNVRLAALQAGSRLGDARTVGPLRTLAEHDDPTIRAKAAELFINVPQHLDAGDTLLKLVDDQNLQVRLAAYRTLSDMNDPRILRHVFRTDSKEVKFILELVPATRPLIYVSQDRLPRVTIFGPSLGFTPPAEGQTQRVARAWDNRLMVRTDVEAGATTVFYRPLNIDHTQDYPDYEIGPTVYRLVFLLGHRRSPDNPNPGLNLTFSDVASALYELCESGEIPAPIELQINPLAAQIAQQLATDPDLPRPEFDNLGPMDGEPDAAGVESAEVSGDNEPGTGDAAPTRPEFDLSR